MAPIWVFLIAVVCINHLHCAPDTQGTEFIIGFIQTVFRRNDPSIPLPLEVHLSTQKTFTLNVRLTSPEFFKDNGAMVVDESVSVIAGSVTQVFIGGSLRLEFDELSTKAVRIVADDEISVQVFNKHPKRRSGAYLALPVDVLGTRYIAATMELTDNRRQSVFLIVGIQDNTDISIIFNRDIRVMYQNSVYTSAAMLNVTLNRYSTLQLVTNEGSFSGSRITSSMPVAVTSGNDRANTFRRGSNCRTEEMLIPVDSWGRRFVLASTPQRLPGTDTVFTFIASETGTRVEIYCIDFQWVLEFNLLGQQKQIKWQGRCTAFSNKAITVFQYVQSMQDKLEFTGPTMITIPSIEQYSHGFTFLTPMDSQGFEHETFIVIFINRESKSGLRLNNNRISEITFESFMFTDIEVGIVTLKQGINTLSHTVPSVVFGAYIYGRSEWESFGFPANMRLARINTPCQTTVGLNGDGLDNDCDGSIDEEICDGVTDDDNDGEVDEDCARLAPVDGGWSAWRPWEITCYCVEGSDAVQYRYRRCNNPTPMFDGQQCPGSLKEDRTCDRNCPIHGGWTDWSDLSACPVTCESGFQQRQRYCTNPTPQNGGLRCFGSSVIEQECYTNAICPVDGGWSLWEPWESSCHCVDGSTSEQYRYRTCTNPEPLASGAPCAGDERNSRICPNVCLIDGTWSDWTLWSSCSVTCDEGIQTCERTCTNPAPSNGGTDCMGSTTQDQICSLTYCIVDGAWSAWQPWTGECVCVDGTDSKEYRYRICNNPEPQHGGAACPDNERDERTCPSVCPVDGGWTSWQQFPCSVTCGVARYYNTRTCTNPVPQNGGQDCAGNTEIASTYCDIPPCPVNGGWTQWRDWVCSCVNDEDIDYRYRSCTSPEPTHGGLDCVGNDIEIRACQTTGVCPVDGEWSEWSDWTTCSVTCDLGTQTRGRQCNNPAPLRGGVDCLGSTNQETVCTAGVSCPINGDWTDWGQWDSVCYCVEGTDSMEYRYRSCSNPEPMYGGLECAGGERDGRMCQSTDVCPVAGGWSVWEAWAACSVNCDMGTQTRGRQCNNPVPENGGANCLGSSSKEQDCFRGVFCPVDGAWSIWYSWTGVCKCVNGINSEEYRYRDCNNPEPQHGGEPCNKYRRSKRSCPSVCTVDGGWAEWAVWSACSVTCGEGSQSRDRACSSPDPQHGGRDCSGSNSQQEMCIPANCPVHGGWKEWEAWESSCHCVNGTLSQHYRYRSCTNPEPLYGGEMCTGISKETQMCPDVCPVDGAWSVWSGWTLCSVTCDQGTHTRVRSCTSPAPVRGGADCRGSPVQNRICYTDLPCPVHGAWSSWELWDSTCHCIEGSSSEVRHRACDNPEPRNDGSPCHDSGKETRKCHVDVCPVDGGWDFWTPWSECSVTCGDGTHWRERSCTNPTPRNGGNRCRGSLSQIRPCYTGVFCDVDGGWSEWEAWENACNCVNSTTALQYRERLCNNPAPKNRGLPCPEGERGSKPCEGNCPIEGGWSPWTPWTQCSVTCEQGLHARQRSCTKPTPQNGGAECLGDITQEEDCFTDVYCPVPPPVTWEDWHSWRPCSDTCTQTRIRYCAQFHCEGPSQQVYPCYMGECEKFEHFEWIWADWAVVEHNSTRIGRPSLLLLMVVMITMLLSINVLETSSQ